MIILKGFTLSLKNTFFNKRQDWRKIAFKGLKGCVT